MSKQPHTETLTEAELAELAETATIEDLDLIKIGQLGAIALREQLAKLQAGELEAVIAWFETEIKTVEATLAALLDTLPTETEHDGH
jgi:uncharacterized small protein (DUF1192 family)